VSADSTIPARCKTTGAWLADGAPRMSVHRGSRGRRVMAAALVLVLGAAACAGEDEGEGRSPAGRRPRVSASVGDLARPTPPGHLTVRLAYVGDYALEEAPALVAPGYQGASLAAEQATEAGGLPADVEVVSYSTDGDTEKALEVAGELAADPQVVGVLIAPYTAESRAVGAVLQAAGLPQISLSSLDPSSASNGWSDWRRAVALAGAQARALAAFARALPATRAGICLAGDGSGLAAVVGRAAGRQLQGNVRARITVPPGDASAARAAATVRRAGCGVVLWTGYGARAAALRLRLSTSGRPVQMLATDAAKTESYLTETGREGDGTVVSCGCVDLTTSTRLDAQRFINAFQFDIGALPGPYAVEGWDAGNRFIEAVRRGAITRGEVATALEGDRSYDGLAGTYAFRGDGELEPSSAAIRFYRAEAGRWIGLGSDDGTEPFGVRSEGTLTAGSCRWGRPFAFRRGGRLRGFDVAVAGDIAARLGLRLGWRRIACGNQDRALASGRVDVLAGVQRPGPKAGEDSRIYLSLRQALVVRHGSGIHGADDLGHHDAVAVVRGSAGDRWARGELAPGGTAIERLTSPGRAFDRLRRGRVDAVLADESSARSRGDGAIIASTVDVGDYRVFAVSREDPGLLAAIDGEVAAIVRSRAYRRAFARWFPGVEVPPETGSA
jgi:branched-chain amino acid transport system substrate-binding protein